MTNPAGMTESRGIAARATLGAIRLNTSPFLRQTVVKLQLRMMSRN
jgi:hypothetical protein